MRDGVRLFTTIYPPKEVKGPVPEGIREGGVELPDVLHTFKAGHRLMIPVKSSWFPLADRNPRTFVDIYRPKASDYRPARPR